MVEGIFAMSGKERERLRIVEAVDEGRLKRAAAGKQLGLSVRQVKR